MAKNNMRNAILLLFCISFPISQFPLAYTNNNNNATCIGSERRALLEFKGSLVDTANRLASWTAGVDCCTWDGVTCNPRTGHVQKLHLRNPIQMESAGHFNNCLGGAINPSLLNLEHLNYLDLSFNYFWGIRIPTFLGSLKNLRHLNLCGAGFGGEIPPQLGNLSHLQYLSLGDNGSHMAVPVYVGNMSNYLSVHHYDYLTVKSLKWISGLLSLKYLDLSGINLRKSVDWLNSINMLPSLSSLSLMGCGIVDGTVSPSPSPILNLTSLVSLDLGLNCLMSNSTLLLSLLNLSRSQLEVLRLDRNYLQGPIPILSETLITLIELDLSYNSLDSSSMPHSLCNSTNLIYLDLSGNAFQGLFPLCLGNLTSLKLLHLSENGFFGKIPSVLGNLKQLTDLRLNFNYFNYSIPSSIGRLSQLEYLHLSQNQLSGVIPSTIGQLRKLQQLDISQNSLTGELPTTLGQLVELQELDISRNLLTGELSESHFLKLKCLKYLIFSGNHFLSFAMSSQWVPLFQLRGIYLDSVLLGPQFPLWLQTQRDVETLSMNNASISDVIPVSFMSNCSFVKFLDLSNNNIHGSLISFPPNILSIDLSHNFLTLFDINYLTNMSLIKTIQLNNNLLVGSIPNDLCSLPYLRILSLANNQLTGNIPLCFGNLQHLVVLDLANNSLFGRIPSTLGNLWRLSVLHLSRNKFYGLLPTSLKNLKSLITLDLGENQLTGTIPEWIGKELSYLQFLRLESNHFYGNLSIHLCQLSALQILNLAGNNLVGHIPHCFGNFSMMMSIREGVSFGNMGSYTEALWNIMKGIELQYSANLGSVNSISLSGNNIHGEIPSELMILEGLQGLNLSNNKLSGRIPENIGNLKHLESLDLAVNQLSGPIPQSLASIDTLSYLNLSFNNLVGRMPSGSHFDTLIDNQTTYEGNSGLCGKRLAKSCPNEPPSKGNEPALHQNIDDEFDVSWFYAGIAPGFAVGLVGVLCILYFNKSWRHAYFGFVQKIYDGVCVTFAQKIFYFLKKVN